MSSHDRELTKAAITHAYDEATTRPEAAQVYTQVAIAQALLEVADAIRDLAAAERGEEQQVPG